MAPEIVEQRIEMSPNLDKILKSEDRDRMSKQPSKLTSKL